MNGTRPRIELRREVKVMAKTRAKVRKIITKGG